MFKFTLAILAATLFAPARRTVYSRCSLAKLKYKLGVPKDQLARWTCIAEHESSFNSKAVGPKNSDGSSDYGIFQITYYYYWSYPASGAHSDNACRIKCEDFLVNSIEPNLKCAQLVLKRQGWGAWSTWKFCDGSLPSINNCL